MNYLYIILIVCLFLIATIIIYYVINNNKKKENNVKLKNESNNDLTNNKISYFPAIQIIENNIIVPDEKNIIKNEEIKNTLAAIDNVAIKGGMIANSSKIAVELANSGRVIFSASAEDAAKMIKNGEGKYLGTQVSKIENLLTGKRKNSFTGQAQFTKENNLVNSIKKEELTNITMNAASMVVGQYYMSEINDKLEEMKESIDKISSYQKDEYSSRIVSTWSKIDEITKYLDNILLNEEARKNSYNDIKKVENECTKLLGQANKAILNNTNEKDLNSKQYFKKVKTIEEWFKWQQIIQSLFLKAEDLRFILANGIERYDQAHHQFNNYVDIINKVNNNLELWHKNYIDKMGIDIDKNRKKGNLFTIRKNTIGLINKDWSYDKLDKNIINQISNQIQPIKYNKITNTKKDELIVIQKYKDNFYIAQKS